MIFFSKWKDLCMKNTLIWPNRLYFQKDLYDIWAIEKILHLCVSHAGNVCKSQNTLEFCFSCFIPGLEVNF